MLKKKTHFVCEEFSSFGNSKQATVTSVANWENCPVLTSTRLLNPQEGSDKATRLLLPFNCKIHPVIYNNNENIN